MMMFYLEKEKIFQSVCVDEAHPPLVGCDSGSILHEVLLL